MEINYKWYIHAGCRPLEFSRWEMELDRELHGAAQLLVARWRKTYDDFSTCMYTTWFSDKYLICPCAYLSSCHSIGTFREYLLFIPSYLLRIMTAAICCSVMFSLVIIIPEKTHGGPAGENHSERVYYFNQKNFSRFRWVIEPPRF